MNSEISLRRLRALDALTRRYTVWNSYWEMVDHLRADAVAGRRYTPTISDAVLAKGILIAGLKCWNPATGHNW